MIVEESWLNQLIANQRNAIRYYLLFAIGLVVIGILVIAVGFLLLGKLVTEGFKMLIGIGGTFVGSLTFLRIKDIIQRKEKVEFFETMKIRLHKLQEEGELANQEEKKRIEELLWKVVEKTAGG